MPCSVRPCGMDGCLLTEERERNPHLCCVTLGKCISAGAVAFYFTFLCVSSKFWCKVRNRWALAWNLQCLVGSLPWLIAQLGDGCCSGGRLRSRVLGVVWVPERWVLCKNMVQHDPYSRDAHQNVRSGHLLTERCELLFCKIPPSFPVLAEATVEALLHWHTLSIKNVFSTLITLKSTCLWLAPSSALHLPVQLELDVTHNWNAAEGRSWII